MGVEIERKFLVKGTEWKTGDGVPIRQGYLNREKERTIRVRIAGPQAFITIKGITQRSSRAEFEYEIPVSDAEELLSLCEGLTIEKARYTVVHTGTAWEIDEFSGVNTGLIIAEVELQSEDEEFNKPPWLAKEVTNDFRYYNANLSASPYSIW